MSDLITEWLGAYHDGELQGGRLRQVEIHLAGCAACRAELDEIRALAALLQETVGEAAFLPAERFAAHLRLRLPRRDEPAAPRRISALAWWLVPAGLAAIWFFFDTTFSLRTAAELAAGSGLLGGGLGGAALEMRWFSAAMGLIGDRLPEQGTALLAAANAANLVFAQILGRVLPQAIVAAAYFGWLLAWWMRRPEAHFNTRRATHV